METGIQSVLAKFEGVSGKMMEIKNCDIYDFQKEVHGKFGTNQVLVSTEYLEDGNGYRSCTARLYENEDIFIVIGFTKTYSKLDVIRSVLHVPLSIQLDATTFSKVIHVSHDDLDGESPVILSRMAFADKELVTKGCSYDKVDEIVCDMLRDEMNRDSIMFITDISVNEKTANIINALVEDGFRIFMFDHHDPKGDISAFPFWMNVQMTQPDGRGTAATSMYYDFLLAHGFIERSLILDDYVELVRCYDTWEWDDTDNQRAKRLNDYFFMCNRAEFNDQVLFRLTDTSEGVRAVFSFDYHIEYMLDMEQKRIDEFCHKKKKQIQTFKGLVDGTDRIYTYGVVVAETYQSELGNYLCKKLINDMDFVVMLDVGSKKMSLRCNKYKTEVDVGAIARSLGGGGRQATAGCPLNVKTKHLFLDQLLSVTLA